MFQPLPVIYYWSVISIFMLMHQITSWSDLLTFYSHLAWFSTSIQKLTLMGTLQTSWLPDVKIDIDKFCLDLSNSKLLTSTLNDLHVLVDCYNSTLHTLRWFPCFALRMRVQNVRDFPQAKLDSEVNAPFLLNEHGEPHFLFYKFRVNNILNHWEKNWQKSMATFLANEINTRERDIMDPTEQVQIMFPLKDRIMQGMWRHFFGDVDE